MTVDDLNKKQTTVRMNWIEVGTSPVNTTRPARSKMFNKKLTAVVYWKVGVWQECRRTNSFGYCWVLVSR